MGLFAWIVIGGLAGAISSRLTNTRRRGCLGNVLIGVLGGVVGGWITRRAFSMGIDGFSLQSLVVCVLGAVLLLALFGKKRH